MKCFKEIVKGKKLLTIFVKYSISGVWQSSKYAYVIYYLLFGKTLNANTIHLHVNLLILKFEHNYSTLKS